MKFHLWHRELDSTPYSSLHPSGRTLCDEPIGSTFGVVLLNDYISKCMLEHECERTSRNFRVFCTTKGYDWLVKKRYANMNEGSFLSVGGFYESYILLWNLHICEACRQNEDMPLIVMRHLDG